MMPRRRRDRRCEKSPSRAAISASRISSNAARSTWPLEGPFDGPLMVALRPSASLGGVVAFALAAAVAATDARSLDLTDGMVLRPFGLCEGFVDFARPLRAFGFRATVAATDPRFPDPADIRRRLSPRGSR